MTEAKIIFFGTSEFSAAILQTLYEEGFNITAVVTQPDKAVGRKQTLTESAVAAKAQQLGITTLKPKKLDQADIQSQIKSLEPELFVVISYGKIIPQALLDIPKRGALNIHPSLLPKYRGATPIHQALLSGDKETGVTIMLMDAQMDHGPMLLQETVHIEEQDTFPDLEQKLLTLSQELITLAVPKHAFGTLTPQTQEEKLASYTKIIKKTDGRIDWNESAEQIYNKFRAYVLWPGIFSTWNGKTVKILDCVPSKNNNSLEPGEVGLENDECFIQTANGQLQIMNLQLEGKKPTQVKDFLRGYRDFVGSKLI
jgi:methionyl-tRNA formyltransferase